eukprot:NODE_225_length_12315_cov_1.300671.p4 type:complete len:259 gc:universal NODE_225_length_12315_cov_1.300671:11529-12305(+)
MLNVVVGWILHSLDLSLDLTRHDSAIDFLQNSPFDVKLNQELCIFFGNLYKWSTAYSLYDTSPFQFILLLGIDTGLNLFINLLYFTYAGHFLFYVVMSRVQNLFYSTTYSLFLLFRSKRYNVLKNRTENTSFEMDQFILGTIIFIPFILAFPTVIIFYSYSVYMILELYMIHFLYFYVKSFLRTEFKLSFESKKVTFFSNYPCFETIQNHFITSYNNMEIKMERFSLYQVSETSERANLKQIIRGVPFRLKAKHLLTP